MSHCRSKAYRDFWNMAYHAARSDRNPLLDAHDHMVKYIIKAAHTCINEHAVDLCDAMEMVEEAIGLTKLESDVKLPTGSELRRFKLGKDAEFEAERLDEETEMVAAFGELLLKSTRAKSPQQTWKLFYRAQRLAKLWRHNACWLVNLDRNSVNSDYISEMTKCVTNIIYPIWVISQIGTRLCQLKLKSNNPLVLYTGNVADLIDDELPF